MAITLFRNIDVQLARDTALTKKIGEQSLEAKKDSLTHKEGNSIFKVVAASAVDEEVSMEGVTTGKYVRIETDQPIEVKLSGIGNTSIPVKVPSVEIPGSMEVTADFTSIHISNAGTNDANVHILFAGE